MATPLKWTYDMETVLIEEIKSRRQLWDHKCPFYKFRKLKQTIFEDISIKMREMFPDFSKLFTVASIISKFTNLKTVYQRNKKKLQNLSTENESLGFESTWTHFEQMKFLDNDEQVELIIPNLDISREDSQLSLQDTEETKIKMEDLNSTDESYEPHAKVPRTVISRKRKTSTLEDDLMLKAYKTLSNVAEAEICAEDALGQYLAQKLKSIQDPLKRNAAEADLVQTIMKYV